MSEDHKISSVALAIPATRMVVVAACIKDYEGEPEFHPPSYYPVVAVRSHTWKDGIVDELLVIDMDSGSRGGDLCTLHEIEPIAGNYETFAWSLAVCPWSPEDDEVRLGPIVAMLRQEILDRKAKGWRNAPRKAARA